MPIADYVNAIVNLLVGVGMFIVIIRVSKLIEKITSMLDKTKE
jgi:hypothetical protein